MGCNLSVSAALPRKASEIATIPVEAAPQQEEQSLNEHISFQMKRPAVRKRTSTRATKHTRKHVFTDNSTTRTTIARRQDASPRTAGKPTEQIPTRHSSAGLQTGQGYFHGRSMKEMRLQIHLHVGAHQKTKQPKGNTALCDITERPNHQRKLQGKTLSPELA